MRRELEKKQTRDEEMLSRMSMTYIYLDSVFQCQVWHTVYRHYMATSGAGTVLLVLLTEVSAVSLLRELSWSLSRFLLLLLLCFD